jgi:hypothetical protein
MKDRLRRALPWCVLAVCGYVAFLTDIGFLGYVLVSAISILTVCNLPD